MRPSPTVEWIETNVLGGYAFGTSSGCPTRRYHGFLISARRPPVDRRMLIAQLLASVLDPAGPVPLDPPPGAPSGGSAAAFERDPFPLVTYRIAGGKRPHRQITRTLFMRHDHNTTVVRYRLVSPSRPLKISLRVLTAFRDHHAIFGANPPEVHAERVGSRHIRFWLGTDSAYMYFSAGEFVSDPKRIGPFQYEWDTRQGMEDIEWFQTPGCVTADLTGRTGLDVILSDRPILRPMPDLWQKQERSRRRRIAQGRSPLERSLNLAADQFLVMRLPQRKHTIVAGYPWFTDWGRDTMISLEGLALVRGEFDAAEEILAVFAGAESRGMIPNHYPDTGEEPQYNTVDASLWFFEAGRKFLEATGRSAFVRRILYPVYRSILQHHLAGTRFRIHAESETGLLYSGEEGTQLTWMDAKVDDWVVTPRHGYPVEIQALWYNALKIFSALSRRFKQERVLAAESDRIAALCRQTFSEKFWNESRGCLYDGLAPDRSPMPHLRPNQLLALSLTHPILIDPARCRRILFAVRRHLLTPVGLRTLSPDHPDYRGRHEGSRRDRDAAYHQGTVWPWLLGPYARACLNVEGDNPRARRHLRSILRKFHPHLSACAAGTVSEIFDGDPPHEPKGCVAQAWSVAELLVIARMVRGA